MKKLFFTSLMVMSTIFSAEIESDHFHITFTEQDRETASVWLGRAEVLYEKLRCDFQKQFDTKVEIIIHENQATFREAAGLVDAPAYKVASFTHPIHIVSPSQPGSYHTEETLKWIFLRVITSKFIRDNYSLQTTPGWVGSGFIDVIVCQDYASTFPLNFQFSKLPSDLPTMDQLDASTYEELGKIGGVSTARSLTLFIDRTYGREKFMQFLENYEDFEEILGVSKDECYAAWVASLEK